MINFKLVYKVIGSLLFIEAMMMFISLLISAYYGEDDILAFLIAIAITVLLAIGLKFKGYGAENSMGRREAYLLVSLIWVVFSALGALPFVISGYLTSYTDAFLRDDVGLHYYRRYDNRRRRGVAPRVAVLALADPLDRWFGYNVLYHSHIALARRGKRQGFLCRSNRPHKEPYAPAS